MDLDRNLIPFTNPGAMWINHFSRFGPFWPFRELSGIQAVGCIIGTKNHILTGGLLRWRVLVDGEEQTPGFPRRDYYPWVVVETTLFGPVSVSAHTYFVGPDQIKTNFIVSGQAAADIRIEFESPWDPVRPIPGLPRHPWPPEVYRIDTEPVGELNVAKSGGRTEVSTDFEVFFFYGPPDYPGFKGLQKGDRSEAHWIAETEPWTFRSESEFSQSFHRHIGFGFDNKRAAANLEAGKTAESGNEAERFQRAYANVQSLETDAIKERLRRHAIGGLMLTVSKGHGGFWGDKRITLANRYHIVGQWYWDTAVTMLGLREFAPEIARESALALLENLADNGAGPLTLTDVTRHGEGQGPLLAYGIWMLHQKAPDIDFLRQTYPLLVKNNGYWFNHRAAASGLCKWANAAQSGGDNDARFEPCGTTDLAGNVDLFGAEHVDLNSYLVIQMRCLSKIAADIGLEAEAKAWGWKADHHGRKIVERMWFPEYAMFFDVNELTCEPFTMHKTPASFLPIWAGVPLSGDQKKRIIENHLLNPNEFFGSYPFPSLSYDDPLYNPHSYWRGRIWPHIVYWMIEILWQNGYEKEAVHTANRLIEIFQTTPYIHECYPSDGYDPHMGLPEYNWSLAVLLEMLLERYKEPRHW